MSYRPSQRAINAAIRGAQTHPKGVKILRYTRDFIPSCSRLKLLAVLKAADQQIKSEGESTVRNTIRNRLSTAIAITEHSNYED